MFWNINNFIKQESQEFKFNFKSERLWTYPKLNSVFHLRKILNKVSMKGLNVQDTSK